MFVGILLLILGVLMLLDKLGIIYGSAWDYFFPVALIALGASFMMKDKRHSR